MNEPIKHDETPLATADPELEQLLADAYDAPPVPRSLLKRIDRAVEAEWGESPGLADNRAARFAESVARRARWLKTLPIAATAALMVLLVILFSGDSRSYAWAAMLEALEKQGVVQVQDGDETRWMSLAEGVVGGKSPESTRVLDLRRQVVLERSKNEQEVRRRKLDGVAGETNRDCLVLAFLLGEGFLDSELNGLAGARLTNEQWRSSTVDGVELVRLRVVFEAESSRRLELEITLDPETHLPLACDLVGGPTVRRSLSLTYPATAVVEVSAGIFPGELTIVDVDEYTGPDNLNSGDSSQHGRAGSEDITNTVEGSVAGDGTKVKLPGNRPAMSGAPSRWRPVDVRNLSAADVTRQLDESLAGMWKAGEIEPTTPADDEELLRRVYLDLVGRIPSVNEVRTYLNDKREDRYERLVDRLLSSPDHASHLATVWRTFLIPEGVDLAAFGGVEAFDQWLARRFESNDSYADVVRSLLLAEGRLSRSGPLLFYSAVKLDPDQLASRTSRVFLGMRLECAQCHDHPFEPWTQQDFWGLAAFFARISRPQAELETVSGIMRVRDIDRGEVKLPLTETVVLPSFLNRIGNVDDEEGARRRQLADWLTAANNPYFARATANRVWGHLFGKGIVEPIDDFGTQNPPRSAELLDLLAGHFINSGFSLRELFRTVALSRAYRLSSEAVDDSPERIEWFAQMNVKTLTAEQVYDCITVATLPSGTAADDPTIPRFGNPAREEFVAQFRTPAGRRTEYLGGIPQALTLMNGTLIDSATGLTSSGLLTSLGAPLFSDNQRIEILYFATLSRRPRPAEWELLEGYVSENGTSGERQEALADILWALLNSAEFTLNH